MPYFGEPRHNNLVRLFGASLRRTRGASATSGADAEAACLAGTAACLLFDLNVVLTTLCYLSLALPFSCSSYSRVLLLILLILSSRCLSHWPSRTSFVVLAGRLI